jgi:hypothetical protein
MLGQYPPVRTYHLPSAPILTVLVPNLSVSVAEKAHFLIFEEPDGSTAPLPLPAK